MERLDARSSLRFFQKRESGREIEQIGKEFAEVCNCLDADSPPHVSKALSILRTNDLSLHALNISSISSKMSSFGSPWGRAAEQPIHVEKTPSLGLSQLAF